MKIYTIEEIIIENPKSTLKVNQSKYRGEYIFFTSGTKTRFYNNFLCNGKNIFIATGGKANVLFYEGKAAYSTDCYSITTKPFVDAKFLFYVLQSKIAEIDKDMFKGAALKHLQKKKFKNIKIKVPTMTEQHRIVAKLDTVFASIDKAQILQETKSKETENFLGYFVDRKLEKLKSQFPVVPLAELVDGVEYGTSKKCSNHGKYPVLRMGNIKNGRFVLDDLVYTDDKNQATKYAVKKHDVFFNRTNSPLHVGKAAIFEEEMKVLFAGYLIRINPKKEKLDKKFLSYYLNAPSTRKHGYSVMTSGVNQANINGSKLKQYPFIKADIQTQSSLAEHFSNFETAINKLKNVILKTINNYGVLKSAILKKELNICKV